MTEKELARHHAEILIAWADGKPIQIREYGPWFDWTFSARPEFLKGRDFRIKPQPREFWLVPYGGSYLPMHSLERAKGFIESTYTPDAGTEIIHVREVLP